MKFRQLPEMLTMGAIRTLILGSPLRTVVVGTLFFLLLSSFLSWLDVPVACSLAIAAIATVLFAAALIYQRNEEHYGQLEAMIRLTASLKLPGPLPPLRGWRLGPDAAVLLTQELQNLQPRQALEIGCGVSTVLIAAELSKQQSGHVIALEHNLADATRCRHQLEMLGLEQYVQIIHAPLVPHKINGKEWLWYDLSDLPDDLSIDFVLIDGPPVWTQPLARYPAIPLLSSRLNKSGAVVMLDDANRRSERAVLKRWRNEFPAWSWMSEETEDGLVVGLIESSSESSVS